MKLPVYKCHKEVEAFQIHSITAQALGTQAGEVVPPTMVAVPYESGVSYEPSAQKTEYVLTDVTGEFSVVVDEDYMTKHDVYTQGYFVRYADGYQSFSPTTAFEEGYAIADEKPVIVIRVGNNRWTPKMDDLQQVVDLFTNASTEPKGAVVAVNHGVRLSVEQVLRTESQDMYVCSIDTPQSLKELLKDHKKESTEPPLGNPHWFDVVVRPADFKAGPKGHDGRNMWFNNVKDSVYFVRGRSVRSVVLSGVTRAELHPDLETALAFATLTYEGLHGPIVWEEK